ncbi:MAG: Fis family transcriptional regulator [endosymbiont of Galathealinum brachiosum]|uniref:Fis family transcriptional regulator n=1 Tax=endosymbiont of Galathealinum brachiosum TaxID=2200906 RepID=A0A370DIZ7_9GAMM|nr:MAG: Fis family transcriptional regulator [endosymbiont of Galathealinum brachiosum]
MNNTPPGKAPIELQSLIDAQDHAFVVIDAHYNVVAANKAYSSAYGIPQDEIVGCKCHKVSHHSDTPCWQNGEDCPHREVFDTGEPFHVLHVHYDGDGNEEHVRIKGSPLRSASGELFLGEAIYPVATQDELSCHEQRLIGSSHAFLECVEGLKTAAENDAPLLLHGESGSGKSLAARFIHQHSKRNGRSFVTMDCSAISEKVFESELFGHERGAFTGCVGRRHGLMETADGGVLFLDEIGDMSLNLQGRLLNALETGEFRRVGGRHVLKSDVRIICATQYDLQERIEEGAFRADLYYRIAGIVHRVPSLRDRKEDIPALAKAMVALMEDSKKIKCRLSGKAIDVLQEYSFPGNIRELKNILQQAVLSCTDGFITVEALQLKEHTDVPVQAAGSVKARTNIKCSREDNERAHIKALLTRYKGHRANVAKVLEISERTLYRKLKSFDLTETGKA